MNCIPPGRAAGCTPHVGRGRRGLTQGVDDLAVAALLKVQRCQAGVRRPIVVEVVFVRFLGRSEKGLFRLVQVEGVGGGLAEVPPQHRTVGDSAPSSGPNSNSTSRWWRSWASVVRQFTTRVGHPPCCAMASIVFSASSRRFSLNKDQGFQPGHIGVDLFQQSHRLQRLLAVVHPLQQVALEIQAADIPLAAVGVRRVNAGRGLPGCLIWRTRPRASGRLASP